MNKIEIKTIAIVTSIINSIKLQYLESNRDNFNIEFKKLIKFSEEKKIQVELITDKLLSIFNQNKINIEDFCRFIDYICNGTITIFIGWANRSCHKECGEIQNKKELVTSKTSAFSKPVLKRDQSEKRSNSPFPYTLRIKYYKDANLYIVKLVKELVNRSNLFQNDPDEHHENNNSYATTITYTLKTVLKELVIEENNDTGLKIINKSHEYDESDINNPEKCKCCIDRYVCVCGSCGDKLKKICVFEKDKIVCDSDKCYQKLGYQWYSSGLMMSVEDIKCKNTVKLGRKTPVIS